MGRKSVVVWGIIFLILLTGFLLSACTTANQLRQVAVYPKQNESDFPLFDFGQIVVEGDYAYIASGIDGLTLLDVSNPAEPKKVNLNNPITRGSEIVTEGDYIYVTDWDGLKIIDVSDVTNPVEVGAYYLDPLFSMDIQFPYAYLPTSLGKLYVIDISDPTNLEKVGVYQSENSIEKVVVSGQYAYVIGIDSQSQNFVEIVDISDPTNPIRESSTSVDAAMGMAIKEKYMFITNGDLQIFDVSNPTSPTLISSYETPNIADPIKVEGNYAYIGDVFGAEVVDISDIYSPRQVGYYQDGHVADVAVVGDFVYVADSVEGLMVFEYP